MKKLFLLAVAAAVSLSVADAQVRIKYQGEFDAGYSIGTGLYSTGRAALHTIQGVRIGKYASVGLGVGLDFYHELSEIEELIAPVYLNMKGYLSVYERITPYFSFDIGAGFGATENITGLSGLYCTPAAGVIFGKFKAQIGYNVQRISSYGLGFGMNAIQIKLGMIF